MSSKVKRTARIQNMGKLPNSLKKRKYAPKSKVKDLGSALDENIQQYVDKKTEEGTVFQCTKNYLEDEMTEKIEETMESIHRDARIFTEKNEIMYQKDEEDGEDDLYIFSDEIMEWELDSSKLDKDLFSKYIEIQEQAAKELIHIIKKCIPLLKEQKEKEEKENEREKEKEKEKEIEKCEEDEEQSEEEEERENTKGKSNKKVKLS